MPAIARVSGLSSKRKDLQCIAGCFGLCKVDALLCDLPSGGAHKASRSVLLETPFWNPGTRMNAVCL